MRITANNGHSGKRGTIFWPDNVHNSLTFILERIISQSTKLFDIFIQSGDLQFGNFVINVVQAVRAIGCRHVMVGGGDDRIFTPQNAFGDLQPFKSLRAGDFVNKMAINIKQGGSVDFGAVFIFLLILVFFSSLVVFSSFQIILIF